MGEAGRLSGLTADEMLASARELFRLPLDEQLRQLEAVKDQLDDYEEVRHILITHYRSYCPAYDLPIATPEVIVRVVES